MKPHDFAALQEGHAQLKRGYDELAERVEKLGDELKLNTEATTGIKTDTAQIVEAFKAAQGAFATLEWLSKTATKLAPLALLGAVTFHYWQAAKGAVLAVLGFGRS